MSVPISPKYQIKLVKDVNEAIWKEFKSYDEVKYYIEKWHEEDTWNNNWENFYIKFKDKDKIDSLGTLSNIDGETLLKIAIDLGVDTPDFIPSIPTFRNAIKSDYITASATFENAFKQIETHPDIAIGLVNSALESIIKEILKDERIKQKIKGTETLYALTNEILKAFQFFPDSEMPMEVRTIGSSLLAINQNIEKIRSEKTKFHGKTELDYIIQDSLYMYFVVNSVTTVGLFLISYYKLKFPKQIIDESVVEDLPF